MLSSLTPSFDHALTVTGEVGKKLGDMWKNLNEKQKAPYEAKAAADKKRYEEEKAAYTAVSITTHISFQESDADPTQQQDEAAEEESD